jgi:hypothetical protein
MVVSVSTRTKDVGDEETWLKPKADTTKSELRLIDVYVVICFLPIKVDMEDFSRSAWLRNAFSSDMSEPFLSLDEGMEGSLCEQIWS